ncbi:hypothetical protein FH972_021374 [Carpinus fangiana]|uniref:Uncharacterized protein n=1 Tax=Carpinus fangiana TaxID=176857 RepID=A0A5N6KPT3_9ROSI|nr:hypothetical protein FH972_021374 [Carpinus fangiana]
MLQRLLAASVAERVPWTYQRRAQPARLGEQARLFLTRLSTLTTDPRRAASLGGSLLSPSSRRSVLDLREVAQERVKRESPFRASTNLRPFTLSFFDCILYTGCMRSANLILSLKLQGLQESPQPYHWFCPRKGTEDAEVFYEEDLRANKDVDLSDAAAQARKKPIEDAKARQSLALNVMEIFAYSGDDAISYQNWIRTQLRDTVTQCDICSREYHRGRQELAQKLREIQDGLTRAAQTLRRLPQEQRNLTSLTTLDTLGLYALFEALNCVPALVDQDFLRQHFDEAFALAQTKRRMKVQIYTPAMTYFLFQDQSDRNSWASTSWDLFKRPGNSLPTAAEFEYAVREPLTKAMSRVQLQDLDRKFVPRFWSGARSIVYRLDKDLITHSLRALDYDICKLALDHLQIDCDGFPDLLQAITRILTVSPNDFWEAMGATPASVWVEQFFNSKALDRFITRATKQAVFNNQLLEDLYAWMEPFLASIKPVNQPAVCRGILSQLLGTLQHANYPQKYKSFCFTKGIIILDAILCGASNERAVAGARTAGLEALDLLESHLDAILASTSTGHEFAEVSSEVIRRALTLDCKYVLADRTALLLGRPPQPGFCKYRSNIWTRSVASLGTDNMILGNRLLLATSTLTGAEAFVSKGNSGPSNDLQQFNATFDALNRCASSILERIGEFDPEHIQDLFSEKETVDGLFAHLFSSNPDVRSALLEILKAVSGMTVRSEAIFEAIKSYLPEVLGAFTTSLQRIASWETFAAVSTLWIGCKDLLEALCSPTDGILRSRKLTSKDGDALEQFWSALWRELTIVFGTTEAWSNQGHGKTQLMDFCRSAMDFADYTFDQFAIMTGALGDGVETNVATHNAGKRLVAEPKAAMDVIGKWLRLRDPFLLEKSTELICKLLKRLRQYDTAISESASSYIKDVYTGIVKNNLTQTQKAELRRAWERHTGRSMQPEQDQKQHSAKTPQVIDLDSWRANAQAAASKPMVRGQQRLEQVIASSTRGLDAFKAQQAQKQSRALPTGLSKAPPRTTDAADFMKKREAEKAALKRQKQEAIALAKRRANASHTVDEGSGLAGLGVYDVDHSAPKGEGVMVSSSEDSEESDDDVDSELFGASRKAKAKHLDPEAQANAEALRQARLRQKPQAPVKKLRISRNAKDMRARLAPDLSPLHQSILSWDYFHDGPFPQNSSASDYASVLAAFRDPIEYQRTFQPLLLLEAWSSFLKAKEEVTARAFDLKVLNRSSVDAFIELSTSMGHPDGREIFEGDIVLLSKAQTPTASPDSPNAIARVHRMSRKKAHIEVLFRLLPKTSKTSLSSTLAPNSALRAIKITSITPLEREYGALLGLQYYDLCDEITKAKPSPLLNYTDESLQRYISTFRVNKAQAKAIRSAMDNDAFTLVQGPPGTGKTKTIVAIVGAVLSENLRNGGAAPIATRQPVQGGQASISTSKKLLVCAPSNAAVDELVLRFKQGVTTLTGEHKPVNVVRLGKSDAISSSVLDVTLDELVNKRLNPTDTQDGDIEALFRRQLTINDDIEMGEDQISLQARGEPRKLTQPHPTTQSNVNASAQSSARHDLSLPPPAVKKVKSEPLTEQQTAPVKKEKPEKIAPKREHPEKAALQKVQPVKSASQLKRKRSKDEVMRDTPKGGLESGSESSSSRSSKKQPPAKDSKKHTSSNATQPRDVANGAKSSSSAPKTAALPPHLRKKDVNKDDVQGKPSPAIDSSPACVFEHSPDSAPAAKPVPVTARDEGLINGVQRAALENLNLKVAGHHLVRPSKRTTSTTSPSCSPMLKSSILRHESVRPRPHAPQVSPSEGPSELYRKVSSASPHLRSNRVHIHNQQSRSLSSSRTTQQRDGDFFARLVGFRRTRPKEPLQPNDLPPISNFLDDNSSLGRVLKAEHQLKLRCTEFDEQGNVALANGEFKKSELIAKYGLLPRDLRKIDSSLLPNVLVRPSAILINLLHLRVLIKHDRVLVFDAYGSTDTWTQSMFMYDLEQKLKSPEQRTAGSSQAGGALPYEFRALESVLVSVTTGLEGEFEGVREPVVRVLRELEEDIDRDKLRHLLIYSKKLSSFEQKARLVRDAIDDLLEADDDLAAMYLSEKEAGHVRDEDDHTEVEMLLESYYKICDEIVQVSGNLVSNIRNTEEIVKAILDANRNSLMLLELRFSIWALGLGGGTFIASLYGMNLENFIEDSNLGFGAVVGTSLVVTWLLCRYGLRRLQNVTRLSMWGGAGRKAHSGRSGWWQLRGEPGEKMELAGSPRHRERMLGIREREKHIAHAAGEGVPAASSGPGGERTLPVPPAPKAGASPRDVKIL